MTQFQHFLLGSTILSIIWIFFAQKYFKSEKDIKTWKEWKRLFKE